MNYVERSHLVARILGAIASITLLGCANQIALESDSVGGDVEALGWQPGPLEPPIMEEVGPSLEPVRTFVSLERTSSSLELSWRDPDDAESANVLYRRAWGGDWQELRRWGPLSGQATHVDRSLEPDTLYCYQVRRYWDLPGSQNSPEHCAYTRPAVVDDLWRVTLQVRVADVEDAGTNDQVRVHLNSPYSYFAPFGSQTIMDYGRDDFERGSAALYDLDMTSLSERGDIELISIKKEGTDALCLEGFSLFVNSRRVYDQTFGNTAATCRWIDGDDGHAPFFTVTHEMLRESELWSGFVQTFPNVFGVFMPASDLRSILEGMIGNIIGRDERVRWGHLDGAEYVDLRRVDGDTVAVSLDLEGVAPVDDPEIDIEFDLDFSLENDEAGARELRVVTSNLSVGASFNLATRIGVALTPCQLIAQLVTRGEVTDCIGEIEHMIEDGIRRGFAVNPIDLSLGEDPCGIDGESLDVVVNQWADVELLCVAEESDAELVWQRPDRQMVYWTLQGNDVAWQHDVYTPVHPAWAPHALGDVDGDGSDDVVFRQSNGQVHVWQMAAGTRVSAYDVATPVSWAWTLAGVGDVNGDGTDDLIWQHDNGQVHYWAMRGGLRIGGYNIGSRVGSSWTLRGVGDLNGDGTDDIVWQHSSGQVHGWSISGGARSYGYNIGAPVGGAWRLSAVGDVNADGTDDIVFQRESGHVHYWPMHAGRPRAGVDVHASALRTAFDDDWTLVGVGQVHD